jgi:integration host factor subunit beta
MNKTLLIKRLGQTFVHWPEAQLQHMTHTLITLMGDALIRGERVEVRGFGSFVSKHYPSRPAHNPRTGRHIIAEPFTKPVFKASTLLNARLNAEDET